MAVNNKKSIDPASQNLIEQAEDDNLEIVWDRKEKMEPQCGFGSLGICCRICSMGPCRIDPFGEGPQNGICGVNADTIAARNLIRMVAGGAAAHSDHGRDVAHTLKLVVDGEGKDYSVKNVKKLHEVAARYGIETDGKEVLQIASELSDVVMHEFGKQEGTLISAEVYAPPARVAVWKRARLSK